MRLNSLYDCGCEKCSAEKIDLSADKKEPVFKSVLKAAENALKHLHKKGSYQPEDITEKPYKKVIDETYKVFDFAVRDNEIPEEMLAKLQNDAFIFSGLKTHAQLMEATSMLLDSVGVKIFMSIPGIKNPLRGFGFGGVMMLMFCRVFFWLLMKPSTVAT